MISPGKQSIKAGMRLPYFKHGQSSPSVFSASDMNLYVRAINSLLNVKIVRGTGPSFEVTDEAATLQLPVNPYVGQNV